MERTPIVSDAQDTNTDGVAIRLVESPLTIANMLPAYFYQFQAGNVSVESEEMYNQLVDFLRTNEELAVNDNFVNRDDFVKGFQKAVAMVRLWIDSIYLENGGEE